MLKYLGNNFVLSGVISLVLVIAVYVERRNSDKKTGQKSIKDLVFWAKLFGIGYVLVLAVLLMKDKCPISGGCSGGSCFSLGSLKNKLGGASSSAPWSGGGAALSTSASVPPATNVVKSAVGAPAVPQVKAPASVSDSGLKVIDLNNVNIGDPDF